MKWTLILLLSSYAINVSGCFGRSANKDPPPPRVLPVLAPKEDLIQAKAVQSNAAAPSRGQSHGATKRNSVTTAQIRSLSEQLLQEDVNNVGHLLYLNHQGKTNSRAHDDQAVQPLFESVPKDALTGKTVSAMWKLLDNYFPKVTAKETTNQEEEAEKKDFLDAVMETQIMKTTEKFLKDKRLIKRNLREVLNEIWFDTYERSGNTPGSSGFEHVFVGELKKGKVSGFHNWVTFIHEEQDNDIDYKGFMKYVSLGNKGQILNSRFVWLNSNKPVTSMFVGTSPELELALYTVCFYARPSGKCSIQLNQKRVTIQTYPQRVGGKTLVGSAFPLI